MTLKLGIVSDIHADFQSLRMALDIFEREGVEKIVCAGDLTERGVEGDAVVRLIRERNIPCVQGNHDRDVPFNLDLLRKNMNVNHPDVKIRLLTDETLAYLHTLPDTYRFAEEWMRILVAHGTPTSKDEYLFSNSPAMKYRIIMDEADADVIILGHTHSPMQVKCRGVRFYNPGSVAKDEERSSHTCAVLTLPECEYQVFKIATGKRVDVPMVTIG